MGTGDTILVLGAAGQIGTDLVTTLRATYGGDRVIATDVKEQPGILSEGGPFYQLDVLDAQLALKVAKTNMAVALFESTVAETNLKKSLGILNIDK